MNNFSKYEDNLNLIGPILKDKRIEKGLSLEKFSSKLLLLGVNIPVTSLYRIENNQRTVRDYEICAISVVLGVDVNELLLLKDLKYRKILKEVAFATSKPFNIDILSFINKIGFLLIFWHNNSIMICTSVL